MHIHFLMLWELRILIVAVFQRNLCPFLLNPRFQLLNSPWLLLSGSPLHDAPTSSAGDRCGLQAADNSLDALSHLWRSRRQFFPEAAETWTHLTTEHVSTVFLSIWDELVSRELGRGSAQSWYMASSLLQSVSSSWVIFICESSFKQLKWVLN